MQHATILTHPQPLPQPIGVGGMQSAPPRMTSEQKSTFDQFILHVSGYTPQKIATMDVEKLLGIYKVSQLLPTRVQDDIKARIIQLQAHAKTQQPILPLAVPTVMNHQQSHIQQQRQQSYQPNQVLPISQRAPAEPQLIPYNVSGFEIKSEAQILKPQHLNRNAAPNPQYSQVMQPAAGQFSSPIPAVQQQQRLPHQVLKPQFVPTAATLDDIAQKYTKQFEHLKLEFDKNIAMIADNKLFQENITAFHRSVTTSIHSVDLEVFMAIRVTLNLPLFMLPTL